MKKFMLVLSLVAFVGISQTFAQENAPKEEATTAQKVSLKMEKKDKKASCCASKGEGKSCGSEKGKAEATKASLSAANAKEEGKSCGSEKGKAKATKVSLSAANAKQEGKSCCASKGEGKSCGSKGAKASQASAEKKPNLEVIKKEAPAPKRTMAPKEN